MSPTLSCERSASRGPRRTVAASAVDHGTGPRRVRDDGLAPPEPVDLKRDSVPVHGQQIAAAMEIIDRHLAQGRAEVDDSMIGGPQEQDLPRRADREYPAESGPPLLETAGSKPPLRQEPVSLSRRFAAPRRPVAGVRAAVLAQVGP